MGINIIIPIAFGLIQFSRTDESCGGMPASCQKDLDWAVNDGYTKPDWFPDFKTITGAKLKGCSQEDMLLYMYCTGHNPNGNCGGVQRPCGRRICGYASIGWDDVWLSAWTDKGCDRKCQQAHPKSSTWPDDAWNWHEGSFVCHRDSSYPYNYCKCWECQRDCHLREARNVDKCNIADIPTIKNNVAAQVGGVIYDTIANVVSGLPGPGFLIGTSMTFAKGMYGLRNDQNGLLNNVIDGVDARFDQMKGCLKQEISKLAAREHIDEIDVAINQLDKAASEKNPEEKVEAIKTTWSTFNDVVASKYNNLDSATDDEFEKLLIPSQDFVAIYALVSVEYLSLVFEEDVTKPDDEKMFETRVGTVISDFRLLRDWANTAKDKIVDGMWIEMRKFPCRNHEDIVREFDEYAVEFNKNNVQPIEEILVNFETMKSQTDPFLADRSAVCSGSELVKVTSIGVIGHPHPNVQDEDKLINAIIDDVNARFDQMKDVIGDDEIYFYFDVDEMKAALEMSSSDWIGQTFLMYNARSKMFADVKLFSNHGKLAEGESTSDFRVGDQLAFNIEDEHCDDLELEFCLPIASKMFDPVWLCSN